MERAPHIIGQGSVYRSTDPRTPRYRIQAVGFMGDEDDVVGVLIDLKGNPMQIAGSVALYPASHFRYGDHWTPDDTGLPIRLEMELTDKVRWIDGPQYRADMAEMAEAHAD